MATGIILSGMALTLTPALYAMMLKKQSWYREKEKSLNFRWL
jgi:multidrug efflux pump subunit AcrB